MNYLLFLKFSATPPVLLPQVLKFYRIQAVEEKNTTRGYHRPCSGRGD